MKTSLRALLLYWRFNFFHIFSPFSHSVLGNTAFLKLFLMWKINVFPGCFSAFPPLSCIWILASDRSCYKQMNVKVLCWLLSFPFTNGSLTEVHMCILENMSCSRPDVLGWTSWHILILFTGEEGPKSSVLERMGGIELIIIGMCQTKANKKLVWSLMSQSDLFPDFGRWWSQDNYVFYLFPSTELQLPPAENNDY